MSSDNHHLVLFQYLGHDKGPLLAWRVAVLARIVENGLHVGCVLHGFQKSLLPYTLARALVARRRDDENTARPDHWCRRKKEIAGRPAGLVEIGILGKAHPGHGHIVLLWYRDLIDRLGKGHQFLEGRFRFTSADIDHLLLVVLHDVDDESQSCPPCCLGDGLVKRIAIDTAQACAGMIHHLWPVGIGNHCLACCTDR